MSKLKFLVIEEIDKDYGGKEEMVSRFSTIGEAQDYLENVRGSLKDFEIYEIRNQFKAYRVRKKIQTVEIR